jgi:ABC-type transporter Mla subunit MlaD
MNKPVKLRYANQLVGAFVLLVALVVAVVVVLVARRQEWGASTFRLHAFIRDEELDGLRRGTEIVLLGQKAGEISSIDYFYDPTSPDKDLEITMVLRRVPFQEQIFEGSTAHIRHHLAGAGDAFLEIKRGPRGGSILSDGDILPIIPELTSNDRLDEIEQKMERITLAFEKVRDTMVPAFENMNKLAVEGQASNATLQEVLNDFDQVSPRLGPLADKADAVLTDMQNFTPRLDPLAIQAQDVLTDLQNVSPRLRPLTDRAQQVLDESQEITASIRSETDQLEGTVRDVRDTVGSAQEVLDAMRSHWLLRRYIKQPHPDPTIPPSEVGRGDIWP